MGVILLIFRGSSVGMTIFWVPIGRAAQWLLPRLAFDQQPAKLTAPAACLFLFSPPLNQILPGFPTMLTKVIHSCEATKRLCILQTGPATRRLCPEGCNFGTHKRNCTWWNQICVSSVALFCFVLHCCIVFVIPILFQMFKIGIILTTLCLDKLSYWTVGNTGGR